MNVDTNQFARIVVIAWDLASSADLGTRNILIPVSECQHLLYGSATLDPYNTPMILSTLYSQSVSNYSNL